MNDLRIDHLAHPSFDAGKTHRFYTEVMGSHLLQAQTGLSQTRGKSYLLTVYSLGDFGRIDFFEVDGLERPGNNAMPGELQHIGLSVESAEALETWQRKLDSQRISYHTEEQEGARHLYFSDPNGILFELRYPPRPPVATPSVEALDLVRAWVAERGQQAVP